MNFEPAPIRENIFSGEPPKSYSNRWSLWFQKVSKFLVDPIVNTIRIGTATDYTAYDATGHMSSAGAGLTWNDIIMPISNLKLGVTQPAWTLIVGSIYGYVFEDAKTEEVHGCNEVFHDYKEGSDIYAHAHWSPTTTNTGTVRFGLEYAWRNVGEDGMTTNTVYAEQAASGTIGMHQLVEFPAISGTGKKVGSNFCLRFFRDGSHTNDTFTGGAFVPTIGFHYQSDTLGSRTRFAK